MPPIIKPKPVLLLKLNLLILTLAILLTSFWAFSYNGLYRIIAEFELQILDGYYEILTFVICLNLLALPAILLLRLYFYYKKEDASDTILTKTENNNLLNLIKNHRQLSIYFISSLCLTIVLAVIGFSYLFSGITAGSKIKVNVEDLRSNEISNRYVEISGCPLLQNVAGESYNSSKTWYVPLSKNCKSLSTNVFVKLTDDEYELLKNRLSENTITLSGIISKNALPGVIKTELQTDSGYSDNDINTAWVLEYNNTPDYQTNLGAGFIMSDIFFLILSIYLFLRLKKHSI